MMWIFWHTVHKNWIYVSWDMNFCIKAYNQNRSFLVWNDLIFARILFLRVAKRKVSYSRFTIKVNKKIIKPEKNSRGTSNYNGGRCVEISIFSNILCIVLLLNNLNIQIYKRKSKFKKALLHCKKYFLSASNGLLIACLYVLV